MVAEGEPLAAEWLPLDAAPEAVAVEEPEAVAAGVPVAVPEGMLERVTPAWAQRPARAGVRSGIRR